MSSSTLITDYIQYGLAAARPTTPPTAAGALTLFLATDTGVLSGWNGSSWVTLAATFTSTGNGIGSSGGTIFAQHTVAVNGTAGATLTLAPANGVTDIIVALPATGGTVTVTATPTFGVQKFATHFIQGTTPSSISLVGSIISFAPEGGPTSFTPTPTAGARDIVGMMSPDGTHVVITGLLQGLTF